MNGALPRFSKRGLLATLAGMFLIVVAAGGAFIWSVFRVYVPEDMCAVLIRKTGSSLAPGELVATKAGQKGIQEEPLGPGRHFYNPYTWETKLRPLTVIPSGSPETWEWTHSLSDEQRDRLRKGTFRFAGEVPQIGVVVRKVGRDPPSGQPIVDRDSGFKGILREVLTPGTYKINPEVYAVELHPALVIPAGFVGVVTNLFGDQPDTFVAIPQVDPAATRTTDAEGMPVEQQPVQATRDVRALAEPGERGTLRDVLQPGVYYINPRLQKVTLIEIGYNEYSQVKESDAVNYRISFPSDTGYLIRVGVTVVWGIHPKHAAETINEFGNIDGVLDKIIGPQLRSICRNIGSTYAARDFIQGEKREKFQRDMTTELQRVCRAKNLEILIALVREIEVHAPTSAGASGDVTQDLKRTIQESYIAIENQITMEKQREAATVRAQLEEERKKVDIARETIQAETRVMVANINADAQKKAAEVDAQAALEVATIQEKVARLDAKRVEILGKSRADVEHLKNDAEAKGFQLLVDALGGGEAYNLYTFAQNFQPESIRLFFAGDGTFWTDLSRFEELGAARLLESQRPTKVRE